MSCEIEDALAGRPWSMSGAIYGLDRVHDDEGRPLGERRSPSDAKAGVEIVLEACPYHDERTGRPMNASALAQVKRHWKPALQEFRAFRAALGEAASWQSALAVALDALSEPARQVLHAQTTRSSVTARAAVRHKLAAGYFGVLREIACAEAAGRHVDVDVDTLLDWVKRERRLIGASEVCAGPPAMIRAASRVLVEPSTAAPLNDPDRVRFADLCVQQLRIGVAWELYDLAHEHAFFERYDDSMLLPRNGFMKTRLQARRRELRSLGDSWPKTLAPLLPGVGPAGDALRRALAMGGAVCVRDESCIERLTSLGEGGILLRDGSILGVLGRELSAYVDVRREVLRAQLALEKLLRGILHLPTDVSMKPNALVAPPTRWLDWVEAILGHRLQVGGPPDFDVRLRNHRRELAWPATA